MKKVLLFSGGMDSRMLNFLMKPDVALYINIHGQYSEKEVRNLPTLDNLKIIDLPLLGTFERPDLIVPCRNAYFALAASQFGDEIYLGATYGDRSTDKDDIFCEKINCLFEHLYSEQHWTQKRTVRVRTPFKEKTKTRILKDYLAAGGNAEEIVGSISCYHSSLEQCGECKPCARKWVALVNNGIKTNGIFRSDPSQYFARENLMDRIKIGKYRGPKEDAEILAALSSHEGGAK